MKYISQKKTNIRDITYMWNLKNNRNELIYNELMFPVGTGKDGGGGGMVKEFGMDK